MSPADSFIPIAKPWMDESEIRAASRPIASGWVTQGPEVRAFEEEFARVVGASHACAVSSCTTAIHLALLAAGVGPGDEVVTVTHTFIATANAIRYCGAIPVFVDIDPGTFNMDVSQIGAAISPKTKAILCVHQMGMPCDLAVIVQLARAHGLAVIEDAACAVGSEILWNGRWEAIGRPHGDIACFSFHPRKVITVGDGGMLTTNHSDWDRKFRIWRHNGMEISDEYRHQSQEVVFESYPEIGFNYRMTDIQAAVGREQLKRLPEIISSRRILASRYHALLAPIPGIAVPEEPPWARSNWQSYCVRLSEELDQRRVMQYLLDQNIASRRGIMCIHREPAYQKHLGAFVVRGPLRESEKAQDECLLLPLYPQMTEAEQNRVAQALAEACERVRA